MVQNTDKPTKQELEVAEKQFHNKKSGRKMDKKNSF
jgi:hypothetical protein